MRIKARTTMQINFLVKAIMIVLFVLGAFVFFVDISKAATWKADPTLCPTTYNGQKAGPGQVMCGLSGSNALWYSSSDLYDLKDYLIETSINNGGGNLGGYVVDCDYYNTAIDNTEPYCDNNGNFWCSPASTCNTKHVKTICNANYWASAGASAYDCDTTPDQTKCVSDWLDCNGPDDTCEVHNGSPCTTGEGLPGIVSGCSGSVGLCVPNVSNFMTGVTSTYSTSSVLLRGVQLGEGDLIHFTHNSSATSSFVVFNSGQVAIGHKINISSTSVAFEVSSTERGILIPRSGIDFSGPVDGELYYNTTLHAFKYYSDTVWQTLQGLPTGNNGQTLVSLGLGGWQATDTLFMKDGKIGIGTTNPSSTLTVGGDLQISGDNRYLNFNDEVGESGIGLRENNGYIEFKHYGESWTRIPSSTSGGGGVVSGSVGTSTVGFVAVYNDTTAVTGTPRIFVTTIDGYVGINTAIPSNNLSVNGNSNFIGNVGINSSSPSTALVVNGTSTLQNIIPYGPYVGNVSGYSLGVSTSRWNALWVDNLNIGASTWSIKQNGTQLGFYNLANGGGTEKMTVLYNGNVGIDSANPSAKLTVVGTAGNNAILNIVSSSLSSILYVGASGNVGIGDTNPSYKFSVSGDLNITGVYRIGGTNYSDYFINSAGTNGYIWKSDAIGRGVWASTSSLGITATGTAGGDLTGNYPNPSIAVGVVSPIKIATNTTPSALSLLAYNNNAQFTWLNTSSLGLGTVGYGTTGQIPYYLTNGTVLTAGSLAFVSTTAGYLGIGTTNPVTLLTVNGTTTAKNIIPDMTGGIGNMSVYNIGASTTRWNALWVDNLNIGTSTWSVKQTGSRLGFYTLANGGGVESVTILNNGYVGIGTTTAGYKLDVYGGIAVASSTGAALFISPASIQSGYSASAHYIGSDSRYSSAYYPIIFRTGGTNKLYISSSTGNIGFGTTTSQGRLGILADSGYELYFVGNDTANIYHGTPGQDIAIYTSASTSPGKVTFGTNGLTNQVVLDNGYLGIGTDSPDYLLTVVDGSSQFRPEDGGKITISSASSTSDGLVRIANNTNWGLFLRGVANTPVIGAYNGGQLRVQPFSSTSGALDETKGVLTTFDFTNMRVGIGTTNPLTKLHLAGDGSILATGTYGGTGWNGGSLGAGTRLMWIPNKAAFRAGYINGTQWDTANIGNYSTAFGDSNIASGAGSFVGGGQNNSASGIYSSIAGGYYNDISNDFSFIAGGYNNDISGIYSFIGGGRNNFVYGVYSSAFGYQSGVSTNADYSFAGGYQSLVSSTPTWTGNSSFAFGYQSKTGGNSSFAMGYQAEAGIKTNSPTALYNNSVAIGDVIKAQGFDTFALGQRYTNTTNNSLGIAFNTSGSTVEPALHIQGYGDTNTRVGIGGVNTGVWRLHLHTDDLSDAGFMNEGQTELFGKVTIGLAGIAGGLDVSGAVNLNNVGSGDGYYLCINNTTGLLSKRGIACTGSSDSRLKDDIVSISAEKNVLELLNQIRGVYYHWNTSSPFSDDQNRKIGVIAQEVETVLPEVVYTDASTTYKSVDYPKLTAFLIEVAKAQQTEIEALRETVSTTLSVQQSGGQLNYPTGDLDLQNYSLLNVENISGANDKWAIDENGQFITKIKTSDGNTKEMFAMQSPYSEFVFSSSSELINGEAIINFDTSTCEIIDESQSIKVNITLTGECSGIFVKEKTATGFVVKELNGGSSSSTFDWMVIAKRKISMVIPSPPPTPDPVIETLTSTPDSEISTSTPDPEIPTSTPDQIIEPPVETPTTTPELPPEPPIEEPTTTP